MALLCHSERRLPEPRNQREAAAATVLEVETSDLNSEVAGGRRVSAEMSPTITFAAVSVIPSKAKESARSVAA